MKLDKIEQAVVDGLDAREPWPDLALKHFKTDRAAGICLRNLRVRGLVTWELGRGWKLTAEGQRRATPRKGHTNGSDGGGS